MVSMDVSIVKCNSYNQEEVDLAVKKSLDMIGFEFEKDIKVLLKPNLIGPFAPEDAATTHPSVLIALCKILKEKNAKVYVGDSPGHPDVKKVLKISGVEDVAKMYGAELLNFSALNSSIRLENEQNTVLKTVELPRVVKEVDLIINLPKLKTHIFMKYTGAVKNLYGFVIGGRKNYYHMLTGTEKKFAEMLLDLHSFVKPQLTIMDAVIGMEGAGPTAGKPKRTGLVLASKDCTSLDIVASEIIGYRPEDIATIVEARKRGFNEPVNKIGFTDAQVVYKKPFRMHLKILPKFIRDVVFKPDMSINAKKCEKCLACYKQCPTKAITSKNGCLKIDLKKCIRCYYCHEICPVHAVGIKPSLILTYGRKLLKIVQ